MTYPARLPVFEWKGEHFEGNLWLYEYGPHAQFGSVDGDLVLEGGTVITAVQVAMGKGPKPLTRAARSLLATVKRYAPEYAPEYFDEDHEPDYDDSDNNPCRCRDCRV